MMAINIARLYLCFKDLYFLATQQAQVGKPRKKKNGGRRRIVLTVHSLEKQQQQISNSAAAAAALQWHCCCCFGLLTRGHAGDYTCLKCPAVHSAQCTKHNAECSAGRRTGLTGREAAGGLSDFRIWSKPGWEQHSTSSVVPSNVAAT